MQTIPSSLLIIVPVLLSCGRVHGSDQVVRAQEELHKRHLFYREMNGQPSPALARAVAHYQKKKGFACTGLLDPQTCASLGIADFTAAPAQSPFVVAETGDLHGANGEALPSYLVFSPPGTERATPVNLVSTDRRQIALSLAHNDTALIPREQPASNERSRGRARRVQPQPETNPLVLAFNSMNRAVKLLVSDTQPKRKRVTTRRL